MVRRNKQLFEYTLPLVGGLDLAPLVALVLLQVAMIVLGHLQAGALVGLSGLG